MWASGPPEWKPAYKSPTTHPLECEVYVYVCVCVCGGGGNGLLITTFYQEEFTQEKCVSGGGLFNGDLQ